MPRPSPRSPPKPVSPTAQDVVIDGIPTACSIVLDFAPGIGDAKGVAEAVRGRDLVTDDELGWGCRLLGLVCLSELRVLGKEGKAGRRVGRIESNIPVDQIGRAHV